MKTKSIKACEYAKNYHNYFIPGRFNGKKYTQDALTRFLDVGAFYGTMNINDALNIARVSEKTFNRWLNGVCEAPLATMELLRLHAFGQPPNCHNNEFKDWRFVDGRLISNDRVYEYAAIELKAAAGWQPMANTWFLENRNLQEQLNRKDRRLQFKIWELEAEIKRLNEELIGVAFKNTPRLRLV